MLSQLNSLMKATLFCGIAFGLILLGTFSSARPFMSPRRALLAALVLLLESFNWSI
jgi:hypothetical protein